MPYLGLKMIIRSKIGALKVYLQQFPWILSPSRYESKNVAKVSVLQDIAGIKF